MMVNVWDFLIMGDRVVEVLRDNFSMNDIWLLLYLDVFLGVELKVILGYF